MKYSLNAKQSMETGRNLGSCKVGQVPVTQQQLSSKVPQAPQAAAAPDSAPPHKGSPYGEGAASPFQEMGLQTLPSVMAPCSKPARAELLPALMLPLTLSASQKITGIP